MALRVGEMMVIVRAQDFASRTLRRVGSEFSHLSRTQQIALRKADLAFARSSAQQRVLQAQRDVDRLRRSQSLASKILANDQALARNQARLAELTQRAERQQARLRAANAFEAQRKATRALERYNRAQAEADRIGRRIDALQRPAMARAMERLQQAQAASGGKLTRQVKAAQKEVDRLNQGIGKGSTLWKQHTAALSNAAREAGRYARAADKAARLTQVSGMTTGRIQAPRGEFANLRRTQAEMGALQAAQKRLHGVNEALLRSMGRLPASLQRLTANMIQAGRTTADFGNQMTTANRRLAEAHQRLTIAERNMLAFNEAVRRMPLARMAEMGHVLSGIGRTMQLVGLIGTGVMAAASNTFARFNKQLAVTATQTGNIDATVPQLRANMQRMQDAIFGMMREFPATADEMAAAAYDIFSSMTVSFGGGMDLLRKFNQLSVATMTDLETATAAGITVLNNFGGSAKDIDSTLNLMVATIRFGRMRLEDFNDMLNKVAPAAANAGMSLRDVAASMALITRLQPSQAMSATGIARLLQVFRDPDFQEGVRKASGGVVELTKASGGLKPLTRIMTDMVAAFDQMATKRGAAELFRQLTAIGRGAGLGRTDRIEAQRAFTFLSKNLQQLQNLERDITGDTKEMQRALTLAAESPGVRWEVMQNQFRLLALIIGEKAIPIFLQLGDAVGRAIDWFRRQDEGIRNAIIRWGAFISVGTLLAGVILGIAGPIVAMIAHFKMWRMSIGNAEKSTLLFGAALGRVAAFAGFGIILSQIVGLERAIKIMTLAWVAWKVTAIASAAIVAARMKVAATTIKVAMRSALIATGWGALAVAAGFAAEYIISHWEEVKEWFRQFWDDLRIGAMNAALDVVEPFSHIDLPQFDWARRWKDSLNREIGGIRIAAHMREELRENERVMDQWLKRAPKKVAAHRRELFRQLRESDFAPGMNRAGVLKMAQAINDAYKRARKNKPAGMDEETFSDAFWKVQAKDFSEQLQKMFGEQKNETDQAGKAWKNYAKNVSNYNKQAAQATNEATTQIMDSLRGMYTEMESANRQAFGQLFQGPWLTSETFDIAKEWGISPRIQDMIRDLDEQTRRFQTWRSNIDRVLKRGVPREFVDQMREMGIEESAPLFENILKASPEQVRKLVAKWRAAEGAIKSQTKMDFADEINRFRNAGGKMGDAIKQGFEDAQVGIWFDQWIKTTFPNVINTAVAQAQREWRTEHPPPRLPDSAKPGAGGSPGSPTTTNSRDDHSKNMTVNLTIPGVGHPEVVVANARLAAFVAKNAINPFR